MFGAITGGTRKLGPPYPLLVPVTIRVLLRHDLIAHEGQVLAVGRTRRGTFMVPWPPKSLARTVTVRYGGS